MFYKLVHVDVTFVCNFYLYTTNQILSRGKSLVDTYWAAKVEYKNILNLLRLLCWTIKLKAYQNFQFKVKRINLDD